MFPLLIPMGLYLYASIYYYYYKEEDVEENDNTENTEDTEDTEDTDELIVIGITGRKRSGKDTVGKHLIDNYGFVRVAYADALKEACKIIFGFTDEQVYGDDLKEVVDEYWNYTPREILQKVGTELFREGLPKLCPMISNDIWLRSVDRQIQKLREKGHTRFVITDVRFPNELDFIAKYKGFTWKVSRPSISIESNIQIHSSEAMIDEFECTKEFINNKTLDDLYNDIDNEMETIIQFINDMKLINNNVSINCLKINNAYDMAKGIMSKYLEYKSDNNTFLADTYSTYYCYFSDIVKDILALRYAWEYYIIQLKHECDDNNFLNHVDIIKKCGIILGNGCPNDPLCIDCGKGYTSTQKASYNNCQRCLVNGYPIKYEHKDTENRGVTEDKDTKDKDTEDKDTEDKDVVDEKPTIQELAYKLARNIKEAEEELIIWFIHPMITFERDSLYEKYADYSDEFKRKMALRIAWEDSIKKFDSGNYDKIDIVIRCVQILGPCPSDPSCDTCAPKDTQLSETHDDGYTNCPSCLYNGLPIMKENE
jgi:predicted  nucleic acid-binding Zn-ribbon protein